MIPINFKKIDNNFSNELFDICKRREFFLNLKRASIFFESETWKKLHSKEDAHSIAYEYVSDIFGKDKVAIYNDKGINYDHYNILSALSCLERAFLDKVDSEKLFGIFKFGRFYFQYIGSTVIYSGSYTNVFENIQGTYEVIKINNEPLQYEIQVTTYDNVVWVIGYLTFLQKDSEPNIGLYINFIWNIDLATSTTEIITTTITVNYTTDTPKISTATSYTTSLGIIFLITPTNSSSSGLTFNVSITIPSGIIITKGLVEQTGPFKIYY